MKTYEEIKKEILKFIDEQNIGIYDLARVSKDLCACGQCRFFIQHYTREGEPVDWGHCSKGNIQHSKRVSNASCGYWDYCRKGDEENE